MAIGRTHGSSYMIYLRTTYRPHFHILFAYLAFSSFSHFLLVKSLTFLESSTHGTQECEEHWLMGWMIFLRGRGCCLPSLLGCNFIESRNSFKVRLIILSLIYLTNPPSFHSLTSSTSNFYLTFLQTSKWPLTISH